MLEQLIAWWTQLVAREPWAAAAFGLYVIVLTGLVGDVLVGVIGWAPGAVRDWRARRAGRRAMDAAYREYRGITMQTRDGRTVGRLVGRSARRRAEHGTAERTSREA